MFKFSNEHIMNRRNKSRFFFSKSSVCGVYAIEVIIAKSLVNLEGKNCKTVCRDVTIFKK